jgi:hypothetical protein
VKCKRGMHYALAGIRVELTELRKMQPGQRLAFKAPQVRREIASGRIDGRIQRLSATGRTLGNALSPASTGLSVTEHEHNLVDA